MWSCSHHYDYIIILPTEIPHPCASDVKINLGYQAFRFLLSANILFFTTSTIEKRKRKPGNKAMILVRKLDIQTQ